MRVHSLFAADYASVDRSFADCSRSLSREARTVILQVFLVLCEHMPALSSYSGPYTGPP